MPSWCCLSLETIDISEAWPLPHFGFQSQVIALDWQNLVTCKTYHRMSLENTVFCFLASSIQDSITREVKNLSLCILTSMYTFLIICKLINKKETSILPPTMKLWWIKIKIPHSLYKDGHKVLSVTEFTSEHSIFFPSGVRVLPFYLIIYVLNNKLNRIHTMYKREGKRGGNKWDSKHSTT